MNFYDLNSKEDIKKFSLDFFKKLDSKESDLDSYIDLISSKYSIKSIEEIKALKIYYFWNYYFIKLFPNTIEKNISNNSDPRKSYLFKYCYKLQKETNGILEEKDYKDYVYCQLKFLKSYREKTNQAILVTPNILNLDRGWKKWKYFKYLMSKKNQTVDNSKIQYVNNDNLRVCLLQDKLYLEKKLKNIKTQTVIDNIGNIIFWNKLGNISNYFISMCKLIDKSKLNKDFTVYKFDENGKKIFVSLFGINL